MVMASFMTDADRSRIRDAVREVEAKRGYAVLQASPEIAELLVDRCDGAQIGKKILTVAVA